jgi:type IV secretory pathway protease TraF
MRKILIALALALVATPVSAQETAEINYYARDFPSFANKPNRTAQELEIERAYNRAIAASDNHAKALAACKSCTTPPVIRVEGTIVVEVRVDDGRYRPRCPYNNCR